MKFDRNTVIGFVVLAVLFFGYFYFTNKQQTEYRKQQAEIQKREQAVKDSLARLNKPKEDSVNRINDSITRVSQVVNTPFRTDSAEQTLAVENELMKVTFTNKGGQIRQVELKQYRGTDSQWVKMGAGDFNRLGYLINTGNSSVSTSDLFFAAGKIDKQADGSQTVSFVLPSKDSAGTPVVTHRYTVKPNDYLIDFTTDLQQPGQLLTQGVLNLNWQYAAAEQETDISYEQQNTQVGYIEDGTFDYHTLGRKSKKEFDENVSWIGIRQRFFFAILQAKNGFSSGLWNWDAPADSLKAILHSTANMRLQVPAGNTASLGFSIYYGPSDFHILKKYGQKYEKLVNLGQGMYAFVRPLNKYVILPIFDFFRGLTSNMGIAILLLTLFIRLLISPLTYSSYLSGAKMKALRPEMNALKEKFGEDRQQMSVEQMKLFREAGVNPLGGCIPALLQIPIFFALFSFFNSEVALRGASFLWAGDLSAYDAPIHFGFHIPLLGNHLSLFNITACVTSFLISVYSMSLTPDQNNPVLKYMPYIFPVFLLFFFNRLPSGLTWYYTVSNLVTLALQFVIQNYIINHDKILAKIEQNRKKPKSKSKWQERMEAMQEQQKKLKEMQQRGKR